LPIRLGERRRAGIVNGVSDVLDNHCGPPLRTMFFDPAAERTDFASWDTPAFSPGFWRRSREA
jgi:hypothetical protein